MKKVILNLVVVACITTGTISCNALKSCFGKKSNHSAESPDKCCSSNAYTSTNTIMENSDQKCDKCGKTSCDGNCSSSQAVISPETARNREIADACENNFTDAEKKMADKLLKSGFIKKIKSIHELDMGYELNYEEPMSFATELLEIVSLEKKCASSYTLALIFESNSNVMRYRYLASSKESKAQLRSGFEKLGLAHLFKQ